MIEKRTAILSNAELRASTTSRTLEGYAAKFGTLSEDLGGFVETIRPGAFARCLKTGPDLRCTYNHDYSNLLGRTRSGTLEVREDATGLWFRCQVPDTSIGRDVLESVRRGDISGCSFSFACNKDNWKQVREKETLRELIDVDLFELGPVAVPAYPDSTVVARSKASEQGRVIYYRSLPAVDAIDGDELEMLKRRLQFARLL